MERQHKPARGQRTAREEEKKGPLGSRTEKERKAKRESRMDREVH